MVHKSIPLLYVSVYMWWTGVWHPPTSQNLYIYIWIRIVWMPRLYTLDMASHRNYVCGQKWRPMWGQGKFSAFSIYPSFTTSIHNVERLSIVHNVYAYIYMFLDVYGVTVNISCIFTMRSNEKEDKGHRPVGDLLCVFGVWDELCMSSSALLFCVRIKWNGDGCCWAVWFSTYMRLHQEYMNNVCGGARGNGTPLYILTTVKRCGAGKARPSCLSEGKHVR